ncbi:MAG: protocatechuate 4,5-dioxygenase subunit alpha [Pseudomonadales bacterium]|nr:protocatechuate 4,5-dioxygenase subunit alpha [Pseudomonadales bacterium]
MRHYANGNSDVPGTFFFDGKLAMKGYALNKMSYSFNEAGNRETFKADPDAYCRRYGLSEEQIQAVKDLDVLRLLELGGNIYYLAKLTGIYGLSVQDLGARQTGKTLEQFKAMLVAQGR